MEESPPHVSILPSRHSRKTAWMERCRGACPPVPRCAPTHAQPSRAGSAA